MTLKRPLTATVICLPSDINQALLRAENPLGLFVMLSRKNPQLGGQWRRSEAVGGSEFPQRHCLPGGRHLIGEAETEGAEPLKPQPLWQDGVSLADFQDTDSVTIIRTTVQIREDGPTLQQKSVQLFSSFIS